MNDNSHMNMLQGSIGARQDDLHKNAEILKKASFLEARRTFIAKILLIVLGAFTATKGVADQIFGASTVANVVIYTVVGVIIAIVAGLEATFKFESKSAELKILAATCQAFLREIDSQWQEEIGTASSNEQVDAARRLLKLQDAKLKEIEVKAAQLGVTLSASRKKYYA